MQYKLNVGVLEPGDIILVGYNDDNARGGSGDGYRSALLNVKLGAHEES